MTGLTRDGLLSLADRCEAEALKQSKIAVESGCWEGAMQKALGMFKLASFLRARASEPPEAGK